MFVRWVLAILLLPALFVIARAVDARLRALRVIFLFITILVTAATVITPGIWDRLAGMIGINSGLDLIVYLLGLVMYVHIAYSLGKFRQLERRIALLVSELALARAQGQRGAPDPENNP